MKELKRQYRQFRVEDLLSEGIGKKMETTTYSLGL